MKLTYDGDFGAVPEQFGGEVGFGLPDLRGLGMPDRGTSLLGTFDARMAEQIAADNAWRLPTWNGDARIRQLGLATDQRR